MGLFKRRKKVSEKTEEELLTEFENQRREATADYNRIKVESAYQAGNYDAARKLLLQMTEEERLADHGKLEFYLSICYANIPAAVTDPSLRDLSLKSLKKAAAAGHEVARVTLEDLEKKGLLPKDPPSAQSQTVNIPVADGMDPNEFPKEAIITLTDPNGQPVKYAILGMVEYREGSYPVLWPVGDEADGEVVICRLENDPEHPDKERYLQVNDDLLPVLFRIFQEKYKDIYQFDV